MGSHQILIAPVISAPFVPTDIAGLTLWLKADALALSDNDPIATWTDSSGNGNDATNGTAGQQPLYKTNIINGKPVARFDGTDDGLVYTTGVTDCTVFCVASLIALTVDYAPFAISGTGGFRMVSKVPANNNWGTFANSAPVSAGEDLALGTFNYLELKTSGTALTLYRNGVQKATDTNHSQGTSGNQVGKEGGAGRFVNADIAELLVYDTALSDANRGLVETYLAAKYAI